MEAIGILGMFIPLLISIFPIVLVVFLLVWIYRIKTNSEIQVQQNQRIIELLEEVKNK